MIRSLVILALWLSLVWPANALSVFIPVTATNLVQGDHRFAVIATTVSNDVHFRIAIIAEKEEIPLDSSSAISIVTHAQDGGATSHLSEPVKPEIPITMKKEERMWEAAFTVSNELLKKPGLCFVFTELAHTIVEGKTVAMPSAEVYEVQLQRFLK
jgi:hypothetical protein